MQFLYTTLALTRFFLEKVKFKNFLFYFRANFFSLLKPLVKTQTNMLFF